MILRLALLAVYCGVIGAAWYYDVLLLPTIIKMAAITGAKRPVIHIFLACLPRPHRALLIERLDRAFALLEALWLSFGARGRFAVIVVLGSSVGIFCVQWAFALHEATGFYVFVPLPLLAVVSVEGRIPRWLLRTALRMAGEKAGTHGWVYLPPTAQAFVERYLKHKPGKCAIYCRRRLGRFLASLPPGYSVAHAYALRYDRSS